MDDFLDTVEARGKAEGKAIGKAEIIQKLITTGKMTAVQIADMLNLSEENVRELAEMNLVTA